MSEDLDFKNWRNFDDATLRRIYGPDKYADNGAAAVHRQNLKTRNFLGGFVGGLLSPVTNTLGMMGVPGMIGAGYGNPKDSNKVAPQPWIIDENSGSVISNPALGEVDAYNEAHQAKQNYLGSNNPYQIVENDVAAAQDVPIQEKVEAFLSPKDQWLADTANSPAQQSGAWNSPEGEEQLWQQHLKNQQWRKDKGRSFSHGDLLN